MDAAVQGEGTQRLRLERFFLGETRADGIFQDRFGTVRRRFFVAITGTMQDGALVLDEHFTYDDGERDTRCWTIEPVGEHGYVGRANDVIGTASGEAKGNELGWRYQMRLQIGTRKWTVWFDDRFFLLDETLLLNSARVSKFGLLLGEATIVFRKPGGIS